ncbi:hypothetical protein [Sphingomonas yabuuchiae]|uniref:Uncharacterized protein n=1 Tax=Sphingomonas yabuuchiae TaxID=172044 RepID=A0AA40ZZ69_9SPHN|nr:hypothetical protein [Sphingomonas yabuuchiae]MBB4608803.1 hypothetical protein [Sphingomonas yabuuchiae]MBN3559115.1 hypothetical protein [Sphingomonas yabuuchiae]
MILALMMGAALVGGELPPERERAMLAEVQHIYQGAGNRLWPDFDKVPLDLVLIGPARETLFCHRAIKGFTSAGRDTLTKCSLQTRPRELDIDLSAAADFFAGGETIAIGYPEALQMSAAYWKASVLHEAFHLYQSHMPNYARTVEALGLSTGSSDGSWMLNYPFPYADPEVGAAFLTMGNAALAFLDAKSPQERRSATNAYVTAREAALAKVSPVDQRYYEFQVGQEGVARWTELTLARQGDAAMRNDSAGRWSGLATSLRAVRDQGLKVWKRNALYVYGAIEAEMLEQAGVNWREEYRRHPFGLGDQLKRLN